MEYLPLSLVRDTCAVKVDRRDDVHAKQRLGDLPKPLRWGYLLQRASISIVLSVFVSTLLIRAAHRVSNAPGELQPVGFISGVDQSVAHACNKERHV